MKNQKKKDLLLLAMKLLQKIPDAINAKAYYQSYLKRKNKKLVKTIENKYSTTKSFRKPKHSRHKNSYHKTSKILT